MKELLDQFRMMLAESAQMHQREGGTRLAKTLQEAQARVHTLQGVLAKREAVLAFVGLGNVGKSTLLSALFGAKVAPASDRPWSSVPVEYRYGSRYEVGVAGMDSTSANATQFSDSVGMLSFIAEFAAAESRMASSMLYARMPSEFLRTRGLVIADTPGFDAASANALQAYLPRADYLFWVIQSSQGVRAAESDFHRRFLAGRSVDVVVNCFPVFATFLGAKKQCTYGQ